MARPASDPGPFPPGKEYVFPAGAGAFVRGSGLAYRLLIAFFAGPFFLAVPIVVAVGRIRAIWPILIVQLFAVAVSAAVMARAIRRHFHLRALLRATLGRELVADDAGFRICRAFTSLRGPAGTEHPYARIDWKAIKTWSIERGSPPERGHRITLEDSGDLFLDLSQFGEREFLELAKARCPVAFAIGSHDV